MGVSGQRHAPPLISKKETRHPLGGTLKRSGQVWKTSPPPGFDPRTVNHVASRYTDCAMPASSKENILPS